MTDLAERYGTVRRRNRVPLLVAAVLVAAFGGWLAWTIWSYSQPQVQSELMGWQVEDDHEVTARVDVQLADDVIASCLVRAFAEDHTVVGEESFEVTASGAGAVEVSVRTERLATAVESVGCTAPEQTRPR